MNVTILVSHNYMFYARLFSLAGTGSYEIYIICTLEVIRLQYVKKRKYKFFDTPTFDAQRSVGYNPLSDDL